MNKAIIVILLCSWLNLGSPIDTNPISDTAKLIVFNEPNNLLSMVNTTSHSAALLAPFSYLAATFDGTTGTAVIINLLDNSGTLLTGASSDGVWVSDDEPWFDYLTHASLSDIQERGKSIGTSFTASNVPQSISDEVANTLTNVIADYSVDYKVSSDGVIGTYGTMSNSSATYFNAALKTFFTLVGTRVISTQRGLLYVMDFIEGITRFFDNIVDAFDRLLATNHKYDPGFVLNAGNGIYAVIAGFWILEADFDLNDILNERINCHKNFLKLMYTLGGTVGEGVTGVVKTLMDKGIATTDDVHDEWMQSVQSLQYIVDNKLDSRFQDLKDLVDLMTGTDGTVDLQALQEDPTLTSVCARSA